MDNANDTVAQVFARYPAIVGELAAALRRVILAAIPNAVETFDEPARMFGYVVGPGYAGVVCTLIPSKTGVKLGIARGATMPDPHEVYWRGRASGIAMSSFARSPTLTERESMQCSRPLSTSRIRRTLIRRSAPKFSDTVCA